MNRMQFELLVFLVSLALPLVAFGIFVLTGAWTLAWIVWSVGLVIGLAGFSVAVARHWRFLGKGGPRP